MVRTMPSRILKIYFLIAHRCYALLMSMEQLIGVVKPVPTVDSWNIRNAGHSRNTSRKARAFPNPQEVLFGHVVTCTVWGDGKGWEGL